MKDSCLQVTLELLSVWQEIIRNLVLQTFFEACVLSLHVAADTVEPKKPGPSSRSLPSHCYVQCHLYKANFFSSQHVQYRVIFVLPKRVALLESNLWSE